ncbi:MAG: bifunctional UDP-N-acetylglucosamine pyrophosphorylase/glucosamine-1-phosphate N-acetyltransferase [Candidatus Omnitrophota bacterium]|jgi:bifunctional UDP-N-acetylglucosamine pyrophosphorylase/glucosamine-1-phosphate N-acetyltransferase
MLEAKESIACVVLAAGAGTRMKSKTPKVLQLMCGLPVLGHILNTLDELGIEKVTTVVGHQKELVTEFVSERAEVVEQIPPRGTGHALLQAKTPLGDFIGTIIVVCGDAPLITAQSLRQLVQKRIQHQAACVVLTFDAPSPKGYGRIIKDEQEQIIGIIEEANANTDQKLITEVNSGAYCFDAQKLFNVLDQLKPDPIKNEIYLTDAVAIMAKESKVVAVKTDDYRETLGINSQKDLATVTKIKKQQVLDGLMAQGVKIVDEATTYISVDVQIGQDTVIHPNTVIEGPVKIGENCQIGPFARIRPGVVIEDGAVIGNFVEINRSHIGKNSLVKHLSYLGDAKIGADVNIGAGTITANFDGQNKYETIIEDGASIGSGTVLIAPVHAEPGAVTGAGAVVTKNTKIKSKQTFVGMPAKVVKKKEK